jgi:aminomethyltransferase
MRAARPSTTLSLLRGLWIGVVTSGTQSPSRDGIGLGYVPTEFAKPGSNILIEVRGKTFEAVVVQEPIYKPAAR